MQKPTRSTHRRGASRLVVLIGLAATALVAPPASAPANQVMQAPTSSPLWRIYISSDTNCQVRRTGWSGPAFTGGAYTGACGTFLRVGGTTYGPAVGGYTPAPYSQSDQIKVGSLYAQCIQTDVGVPGTALKIKQTDCYRVGDVFYTTAVEVSTSGPAQAVTLYRAANCRVAGSSLGGGYHPASTAATERIFCTKGTSPVAPVGAGIGFIPANQWGTPLTGSIPGTDYIEDTPALVAADPTSGTPFGSTCCPAPPHDNAIGLSFVRTLPASGSFRVYFRTRF